MRTGRRGRAHYAGVREDHASRGGKAGVGKLRDVCPNSRGHVGVGSEIDFRDLGFQP